VHSEASGHDVQKAVGVVIGLEVGDPVGGERVDGDSFYPPTSTSFGERQC
jgi:hypothetical protein